MAVLNKKCTHQTQPPIPANQLNQRTTLELQTSKLKNRGDQTPLTDQASHKTIKGLSDPRGNAAHDVQTRAQSFCVDSLSALYPFVFTHVPGAKPVPTFAEHALAQCAEKSWRKLRGFDELAKVFTGIKFKDGIEMTQTDQIAA